MFEIYAPLSVFYSYSTVTGGYKVSLNDEFKIEVNEAGGGEFTASNGYVWRTGDALPNPAPDGMYNGKTVANFYQTFYNYLTMKSLDLSKWNTSNVTRMDYMFYGCSGLTSLDLSSFATSKVTRM